jgi:acyl-CoA synthetase (AMP-forming)/AMP-acid ligase II
MAPAPSQLSAKIAGMNLWLSLNKALTLFPNKVAIVDADKRFTYAQLGKRIANLVAAMQELGLRKGDVVAIAAPNCHEYMEVYYACGIAGIVLSPLNYRLAAREICAILEEAEAKLVFVHKDFAEHCAELCTAVPCVKDVVSIRTEGAALGPQSPCGIDYEDMTRGNAEPAKLDRLPQLAPDDLAQIYFTSGTTGRPKGVMLTQGNVSFNSLAVIADLRLDEVDAWLHAAPMFHLADAWATFAITWVGGTHVFIPYFNSTSALQCIEDHGITLTVLVPTMLNAMLHDRNLPNHNYKSLRMILTGGSPIAPDMVREALEAFKCEYIQLYGMTETSPFLTLSRPKSYQLTGDCANEISIRSRTGRGYIGAEVKVVNTEGNEVAHNNLEVGEIVARGPTIFAGYWKQPEATAQTIRDGWIHTGDLAVVDEEGSINIVDRAKDMIITGGENVYSTEVEYVLQEHPAVMECAVFGIPHEFWGEAVKAVVVLRESQTISENELIEYVRERLAHYKVPRGVDFLDALPKTGSGKIYKKGLREDYWSSREKQVN